MPRRSSVVLGKSAKSQPVQAETKVETKTAPAEPSYLTPLLLLFAASGCAALIYEIVWFQLLQLVIGASAVSLGLLLAAYMGGLCLGSAALSRAVSARHHPLRVYALLELGIGVFGIIALLGVPLVGRIYVAGPTTGLAGLVLRGVIAAVCLLPPTMLMGASLPAIARTVETTPQGVSRLGFLYSANVAGAVFGCLFAGFYLLRVYDMGVATYTAAAINVAIAGLASVLARYMRRDPGAGGTALPFCVTRLRGERGLGIDGARRRGGMDPAALIAIGRDGLYVLDHSRRLFARPMGRRQYWLTSGSQSPGSAPPAESGAGRLPTPARGRNRLDGFHRRGGPTVLAR
jgi:hypothetical protein